MFSNQGWDFSRTLLHLVFMNIKWLVVGKAWGSMKMGSGQKDGRQCHSAGVQRRTHWSSWAWRDAMVAKQCFATCLEAVSDRWLCYCLWFQKLSLWNQVRSSPNSPFLLLWWSPTFCFIWCSVLDSFIFYHRVLWCLWTQLFLILSFIKKFLKGKVALHFLFI